MVHYDTHSFTWYRYQDDYFALRDYMVKKPLSSYIFSKKAVDNFCRDVDLLRKLISVKPSAIKDVARHYKKIKRIFESMYLWYPLCIFVAGQWRDKFLEHHGKKGNAVIQRLMIGRKYSEGLLKLNDNFTREWLGPLLKKHGLKPEYLKLFSVQEIEDLIFINKSPSKKILSTRSKGFFYMNGKIYPIKSMEMFLAKHNIFLVSEKSKAEGSMIEGMTAYQGPKVVGKVQLIFSTEESKKFENGRILVTPMTSPEYLSAIKKAKAIITDEGGITSHIAIVARELKKPAVMGTKIATKFLKDGDIVEVDTKDGIIKKL